MIKRTNVHEVKMIKCKTSPSLPFPPLRFPSIPFHPFAPFPLIQLGVWRELWVPPAGYGAESWPQTHFGIFWGQETFLVAMFFCILTVQTVRTILIGSGTAGWVSSWTSNPHNPEAVQLDQGCCHVFSSASMLPWKWILILIQLVQPYQVRCWISAKNLSPFRGFDPVNSPLKYGPSPTTLWTQMLMSAVQRERGESQGGQQWGKRVV